MSRFLEVAWSIGARLCRDAMWDGDRCNWLGDSLEGWTVAHRSFGPDLYAGTSGIALFLATLNRFAPDPIVAQTAMGAVRQAISRAEDVAADVRPSLYAGWIGIALALVRIADLLDEPSLREEALALVDAQGGRDPSSLDVMTGAAGAVLGLLALGRVEEARRHAARLAAHEFRDGDLTGFAHGAAGMALALLESGFHDAARRGFAYERRWFSPERQNWPDLRPFVSPDPRRPVYAAVWCHGAPGIGLSRLRAYERTGDETYRGEAEAALATTMAASADNFSLCHGLAGNAELFLDAADVLHDPRYLTVAELVADRGIQAFHLPRNPWPCGVTGGGETPGLLTGLAGIGWFYLRMHDPAAVPTVLVP